MNILQYFNNLRMSTDLDYLDSCTMHIYIGISHIPFSTLKTTTMVVSSKSSTLDHQDPTLSNPCNIPVIDLSNTDSHNQIVKACKEFGVFKVTNHGVPMEFITRLETEALKFFSLPNSQKEKSGPPNPNGYGNKSLGPNGDMGWLEYLLFATNPSSFSQTKSLSCFNGNPQLFWLALCDFISSMRSLSCEVLELLAKGLVNIKENNVFSKFLMDEENDSAFRLNNYPPCHDHNDHHQGLISEGKDLIAFGEHTDPRIISILRSNNSEGLQIFHREMSSWISVPPDETSFFVMVGDCLQVMSNGRFKSVKHRVLVNNLKSRVSMIYFGGPSLREKVSPLSSIMEEEEERLYKELTWFEFKKLVYASRLSDNRLAHFEL